jgi:glycosyltransferase involved in cell wall biosynthesis
LSPAKRLVLAFPGDLATRTGGYLYDRRLARELEARGWEIRLLSLSSRFPFPDADDLSAADRALAGLAPRSTVLIDGLALGAMPAVAERAVSRIRLVALVHHPLCLETGLTSTQAARLAASERAALASVRSVIVTSGHTAGALQAMFEIPPGVIAVAPPGTDPAAAATPSTDGRVRLLCVGTVTPRKGHLVLVQALAELDGPWKLRCVGSLDRDPAAAAALRRAIADHGLTGRMSLSGELNEAQLAALYARTDLLVSASLYEGYGMALAEALARGIPVTAAVGGAVAETVPPEAGLLVPPGDHAALGSALRRFMQEPGLADRLRSGALAARTKLPRWADTATRVERVLLAAGG